MKKILLCIISLIVLVGCSNNGEEENMQGLPEREIIFEEMDLTAPDVRGQTWQNSGIWELEPDDFPEISRAEILTREEAQNIGNIILNSVRMNTNPEFVLIEVIHDPQTNFWKFMYFFPEPEMTGGAFHVVIDGNTGEILRMWMD